MSGHKGKIIIVGAGVIGATTAFYLTRLGYSVTIIDQNQTAGQGVTRWAFGWINSINGDPFAEPEVYALLQRSFEHYAKLNHLLGDKLYSKPYTSLFWEKTVEDTKAFLKPHVDAGSMSHLIDRDQFMKLCPLAAYPPECAILSPDDVAINPPHLIQTLMNAAIAQGAELICSKQVTSLEYEGDRTKGVWLDGELHIADHVVISSGGGSAELLSGLIPETAIAISPAALITIAADTSGIDCIVRSPDFELRAYDSHHFIMAKSVPHADSHDEIMALLQAAAEKSLAAVKVMFPHIQDAKISAMNIGMRPVANPVTSLIGQVTQINNLYLGIIHPGIIAAPEVAMTIADQITG